MRDFKCLEFTCGLWAKSVIRCCWCLGNISLYHTCYKYNWAVSWVKSMCVCVCVHTNLYSKNSIEEEEHAAEENNVGHGFHGFEQSFHSQLQLWRNFDHSKKKRNNQNEWILVLSHMILSTFTADLPQSTKNAQQANNSQCHQHVRVASLSRMKDHLKDG